MVNNEITIYNSIQNSITALLINLFISYVIKCISYNTRVIVEKPSRYSSNITTIASETYFTKIDPRFYYIVRNQFVDCTKTINMSTDLRLMK